MSLEACSPVAFHKSKSTCFELSSAHVSHASMGGAAVLDGCPVKEDHDDAALFIIDPQNDFHEGGALAVPGAVEDTERTAAFLTKHVDRIDSVVVTLDSHQVNHIAHGSFWEKPDDAAARPLPRALGVPRRARARARLPEKRRPVPAVVY